MYVLRDIGRKLGQEKLHGYVVSQTDIELIRVGPGPKRVFT